MRHIVDFYIKKFYVLNVYPQRKSIVKTYSGNNTDVTKLDVKANKLSDFIKSAKCSFS